MKDTFKEEIASLFPTPLMRVIIPAELSIACNVFDNTPMLHEKDSRNEYGVHSENTYIMDELECVDLKKFVLGKVKIFADEVLCYDYSEYTFSQTWVTWKEPGQMHVMHTHPNSLVSAVLFYGYWEEGTPAIDFHRQSGISQMPYIQAKKKPDLRDSEFAWERFSIPFKPGTLLIFPSNFQHSVPRNKTNYTRKSVSMNIVPKGELGDPHSLTQLIFSRVI